MILKQIQELKAEDVFVDRTGYITQKKEEVYHPDEEVCFLSNNAPYPIPYFSEYQTQAIFDYAKMMQPYCLLPLLVNIVSAPFQHCSAYLPFVCAEEAAFRFLQDDQFDDRVSVGSVLYFERSDVAILPPQFPLFFLLFDDGESVELPPASSLGELFGIVKSALQRQRDWYWATLLTEDNNMVCRITLNDIIARQQMSKNLWGVDK